MTDTNQTPQQGDQNDTAGGVGQVRPDRTILMPCLHDEPYAYLDMFRPVLSDVAQVWFLSEPEHDLGHRLTPSAPGSGTSNS